MAGRTTLIDLLTWLSPAFPVGGFAYSQGLERAIEDGGPKDEADLVAWLRDLLRRGSLWTDAVAIHVAWRTPRDGLPALAAEV
ncbi:MAG: hypothetical protein KGQ28_00575, partial [Hyphomicrobiales bacterium]|nr:hypothetical protein [Hyphomicrobiales bacterium]